MLEFLKLTVTMMICFPKGHIEKQINELENFGLENTEKPKSSRQSKVNNNVEEDKYSDDSYYYSYDYTRDTEEEKSRLSVVCNYTNN